MWVKKNPDGTVQFNLSSGTDVRAKGVEFDAATGSFKLGEMNLSASEPIRAGNEAYDRLVAYWTTLSKEQKEAHLADDLEALKGHGTRACRPDPGSRASKPRGYVGLHPASTTCNAHQPDRGGRQRPGPYGIIVGLFSLLWFKVFKPMRRGPRRPQGRARPVDRNAGEFRMTLNTALARLTDEVAQTRREVHEIRGSPEPRRSAAARHRHDDDGN